MVEEYDCPIFTNATLLDVKTMRKMHLMSYNIHKGMNIGNRKSVLSGLRQYIRYAKADVVFLQEVAGDARHDIDVSQFEYLADSVWHHYAYGKNAVYDNRHHGNAILSKAPIVEWKNINISTNRFEHRGILHGVLYVKTKSQHAVEFHLLCLHLNLLESDRQKQLDLICQYVQTSVPEHSPLIVAGDMNDWRRKASYMLERELTLKEAFKSSSGKYAKTFPSILPFLPLDRIYFRNCELESCSRLMTGSEKHLSDHIPLTATFTW